MEFDCLFNFLLFLRFLSEVVSRVLSAMCLCETQRIVGGDYKHLNGDITFQGRLI